MTQKHLETGHREKGPPAQGQSEEQRSGSKSSKLLIYRDWCKRCGICVAFCPTGSLEMGPDGPEWKYPERCAGCRDCELRCPDFAIEMIQDSEDADGPKA